MLANKSNVINKIGGNNKLHGAKIKAKSTNGEKNLLYTQELQKCAYNKSVKPWNYALNEKILLNNKLIKTKRNQNLKAKFFYPLRILHPIGKQVYKPELLAK